MTCCRPWRHHGNRIACLIGKLFAIAMTAMVSSAVAQTMYAVSVRTYADPSYKGVEGNLYRVDPTSGATTMVAPLRLSDGDSVGLDGLAIHPKTGEFFGITGSRTGRPPHSLVQLDPATGTVSVIGNLGAYGSDLSFDPEGTLYIWLPESGQIGRVDLKTGQVTPLGHPHSATAAQGGIEVLSTDVALVAASGARGTLDSIDLKTGRITASLPLKGARYPELMAGLAQWPDGTLFGVNTNAGTPALADLVKIDRRTGQVTTIGPLPNDTNAISVGPAAEPERKWDLDRWRALIFPVLIAFLIALGIALALSKSRRR